MIVAPSTMTVTVGVPADLMVTATDSNPTDSLRVTVEGLPPGLQAVTGSQIDGRVEARVYGIVDQTIAPENKYQVRWVVSDGTSSRTVNSTLRIERPSLSDAMFEAEVTRFYTAEQFHGLPRLKARAFGQRSLPILARLLRDPSMKRVWHQIALGIGSVGDTAYFDTLQTFIWERFRGPVDNRAFMGLMQAQASFGAMATISPRVRAYLEKTAEPGVWDSLPWYSAPPRSRALVATMMQSMTVVSISYTDSDWGTNLLSNLSIAARDPEVSKALSIGRGVNGRVRLGGFVQVWGEQDRQH